MKKYNFWMEDLPGVEEFLINYNIPYRVEDLPDKEPPPYIDFWYSNVDVIIRINQGPICVFGQLLC